ncbi:hypothetical protein ACHAWX_003720 [Stephanocyclus meneghinianus]
MANDLPSTDQRGPVSPQSSLNIPTQELACRRQAFQHDGFVLFHNAINKPFVSRLQSRLEHVLRGRFDRGKAPDKMPIILNDDYNDRTNYPSLGFHPHNSKKRVIQIINIHKCDATFREIATCAEIGRMVGHLTGWDAVRLAQDQVWAKPPGAPPLVFHRDSPYFMFTPDEVVTVWIALDDMSPELGPLEYVKSSHKWGDGRVGSSSSFFQSDNGKNLLYSAAKFEGIDDPERSLEIASTAGMRAGGLSIHNGKTWHGSGRNCSTNRPRRGLGLHFIHGDARFTNDARKSRLWNRYIPDIDGIKEDLSKMALQDEDFPLVWKACQDCK